MGKIKLSENPKTVRFTTRGVTLTVDAIAKGLAVDYALDAAKIPGVRSALSISAAKFPLFWPPLDHRRPGPLAPDNDNQLSQTPRGDCDAKTFPSPPAATIVDMLPSQANISATSSTPNRHASGKLPSVTVTRKTVDADAWPPRSRHGTGRRT